MTYNFQAKHFSIRRLFNEIQGEVMTIANASILGMVHLYLQCEELTVGITMLSKKIPGYAKQYLSPLI
jgi:hypothetical protein